MQLVRSVERCFRGDENDETIRGQTVLALFDHLTSWTTNKQNTASRPTWPSTFRFKLPFCFYTNSPDEDPFDLATAVGFAIAEAAAAADFDLLTDVTEVLPVVGEHDVTAAMEEARVAVFLVSSSVFEFADD